jgi:hypothetical protein
LPALQVEEPERKPRVTTAELALLVLVVAAPLVVLVVVLLTRSP